MDIPIKEELRLLSLLGSLSESDSEEGDMESVSSIECGQRLEDSSVIPELHDASSSKRTRLDLFWAGGVEGEGGIMSGYGDSEVEYASSPVPRRRQKSQPEMNEADSRWTFKASLWLWQ